MSAVYPSAKDLLLRGDVDFLVDAFMVQLLGHYTYDPTDTVVADLVAMINPPVNVSVASVGAGMAIANDVTFTAVSPGLIIEGLALLRPADPFNTSDLIAYIDRRSDSTPIAIPSTGGDITFTFTNYLIKL